MNAGDRNRVSSAERWVRRQFSRTLVLFIEVVAFLLGLLLRLLSAGRPGFGWETARELGSFLAVTVAVAFLYETVLRAQERATFIDELDELLERKMQGERRGLTLYEDGRPTVEEKLAIIRNARKEIVELGVALRTFVSYFEQRPASDFKDHVVDLLTRGVTVRCVMLSPDAACLRLHPPGTAEKIRDSARILTRLQDEFRQMGLRGQLEILQTTRAPHFAAVCIDSEGGGGTILYSPYLFESARAEEPAFLIRKTDRPRLFSKVWRAVRDHMASSRPPNAAGIAPGPIPSKPMP